MKLAGSISLGVTMATVPIFLLAGFAGEGLGVRAGIALTGYFALVTQLGMGATIRPDPSDASI